MRRRPSSPAASGNEDQIQLLFDAAVQRQRSDTRRTRGLRVSLIAIVCLFLGLVLWAIGSLPSWPIILCACHLSSPTVSLEDAVIVAHRGCEWPWPENSIPALVLGARASGFVETDLALTKDSDVVLMHDATIDRTTNGSGIVCEFPAAEITKLTLKQSELRTSSRHRVPNECFEEASIHSYSTKNPICSLHVPTLDTVLGILPSNTRYMLDVKVCFMPNVKSHDPDAVECNNCALLRKRVKQLVTKHGIPESSIVFTSSDINTLRSFVADFPSASFAFSVDLNYAHHSVSDFMSLIEEYDWDAVCMYVGTVGLRPDLVQAVTSSTSNRSGGPREVYAWTVRKSYQARVALCSGVKNLIVAYPLDISRAVMASRVY